MDAGEHVGQTFELPARLEPWFAGQVRPGVPLHVHQAALDPGARPGLRACLEDALHPVAHEHVGRRELREQGLVGGGALPVAPLPGEHFAVPAVDRRQQAPAVHVGAVGHDHVVHHAVGADARFELPAPCAASPEGTRVASQPPLGRGFEQPQSRKARSVAARLRDSMVAVVVALQASHCQRCRPFRSCPFLRIGSPQTGHLRARFERVLMTQSKAPNRRETRLFTGKPKMTPRHAYCHNGKPAT